MTGFECKYCKTRTPVSWKRMFASGVVCTGCHREFELGWWATFLFSTIDYLLVFGAIAVSFLYQTVLPFVAALAYVVVQHVFLAPLLMRVKRNSVNGQSKADSRPPSS
jgi:hypothetical protein